MISKWFQLKPAAIKLRHKGTSIREVEKRLNIPRSTLSGWFKGFTLQPRYKLRLEQNKIQSLALARKKAVLWHHQQKEKRLQEAKEYALATLSTIDINSKQILELAMAMLYLGEGFKESQTGIGNTDPLILNFFITALKKVFGHDKFLIKCELHLRADQNPDEIKRYWSSQLNIPLTNFTSVSIDSRTIGSPTYPHYKGVCILQCGKVALQRKLVYLSRAFCEEVISKGG